MEDITPMCLFGDAPEFVYTDC